MVNHSYNLSHEWISTQILSFEYQPETRQGSLENRRFPSELEIWRRLRDLQEDERIRGMCVIWGRISDLGKEGGFYTYNMVMGKVLVSGALLSATATVGKFSNRIHGLGSTA